MTAKDLISDTEWVDIVEIARLKARISELEAALKPFIDNQKKAQNSQNPRLS